MQNNTRLAPTAPVPAPLPPRQP